MDNIGSILSIASKIYSLKKKVKANKNQCHRVCDRVKALEDRVKSIQERKKGQISADVERCLKELSFTLQTAKVVMEKYSGASLWKRVLKCGSHEDDFSSLNDHLDDALLNLNVDLQVEVLKVIEKSTREKQDKKDRKEDDSEMKLLLQFAEEKQEMANKEQPDMKKTLMDNIGSIVSIASQIYSLVENVKANKKRCRRVCDRVKALERLVKSIQQREKGQTSADVERCLKELFFTLQSAKVVMEKYSGASFMKRVLKCGSHEDEFNSLNDRLDDAFQILSGSLQVEQGNVLLKVFEKSTREKQDKKDREQDDSEMKKLLLQFAEEKQEMAKKVQEDVNKIVKMLEKPYDVGVQIIKEQQLKYELVDGLTKKPFMTTPTSEFYRGEYRNFPVAIKRYTDPATTSISEVKRGFEKDVETMKVFQSPNILRMLGICVEGETGPKPQFLIIMEYCEKGSLREVLDSGCTLSWNQKARMCRDAALGLYRLHQSEEKCKVHGCINSSKFLVADGYTVKLGGFEFTQTETSLRKPKRGGVNRSFTYSSPELLEYINNYSKECEVYSFGIVLWEVATGRKPFDGLTVKEVHQKVFVEKYQEQLDDCPKELERLINACRAYDPFQRPSAGALQDKLKTWVTQLEKV